MRSARALITPLLFLAVSLLWIFLSDRLVGFLAQGDEQLMSQLQTLKGSAYVILAAVFIYVSNRLLYRNLEERNTEMDLFYSNNEIAIMRFDVNNVVLGSSRNIKDILGYTSNELIGKHVSDFTPEKYRETDEGNSAKFIQSDLTTSVLEKEYIHKDGHHVPVRLTGTLKRNKQGKGQYFIVAVQDLTAINQERDGRRESEERLSRIVSLVPGVIYKIAASDEGSFNLDFISDGVKGLLGYTPEELYGSSFDELTSKLANSEDREWVRDILRGRLASNIDPTIEFRSKDRKGNMKWLKVQSNSILDQETGIVFRYGHISDITEIKEAEIALEKLSLDLSKRVKELRFINYASNLLQVTSISAEKVISKIVRELPEAFQFPDRTKAIIEFGGRTYGSDETPGMEQDGITVPLATNFTEEGRIAICQLEEAQHSEEHIQFLPEEKEVLRSLAEILRNWLEKQHAESELQRTLEGLEKMVETRTMELQEAHNDITSSIDYAKRIQRTILPSVVEFKRVFHESFVFFRPRDIVSGDFYWLKEHNRLVFIACVDCTGHGVPGALLSMIGNQLLETLVLEQGIDRPDQILEEMHKAIVRLFAREDAEHQMADGMDLSLCIIDRNKKHLSFSGAHNHAYLMRDDEMVTMKAGRHSLGGVFSDIVTEFVFQTVDYKEGDQLYMSTDGFFDQFGGPNNKKYMRKNLLGLFDQIKQLPMEEQGRIVETTFDEWTGDNMQMDDVTVVGIRL